MPFAKGSKHSAEARARMSRARKGKPHSKSHCEALSAALKGIQRERRHELQCVCGTKFKAVYMHARFCSERCKRAASGHGIKHSPKFAAFKKDCAICHRTDDLVGDHCHATGKPRGILCRNCNLALGNMRDDPVRLRAAAAYLENSK